MLAIVAALSGAGASMIGAAFARPLGAVVSALGG
jgi:hypothetical protein